MNQFDPATQNGRAWASAARGDTPLLAEKIAETLREAFLVLDPDLRVLFANPAFYETFKVDPRATEGRLIYDLGEGQWDIRELRRLLQEVLPNDNQFTDYRVEHTFEGLGRRVMILNGRRIDHIQLILLAIDDQTDREDAQASVAETQARETFLLELSDRLRAAADPKEAMALAGEMFARRLGVAVAQYLLIHPDGDGYDLAGGYSDGRIAAGSAPSGRLSDRGPRWAPQFGRGEAVFSDDHDTGPEADAKASRAFGVRSGSAVPLIRDGRLVAIFSTAHPEPRRWTQVEKALQHEVAQRTWAAVERARAEAALRESEERYRGIIEEATDYAIFTTGADNRIETWPPGAQAVFGWTPEEAIGQLGDIVFTPEDRAAGEPGEEYDQARATGMAPDVRWHLHKTGARVFIDGSARCRTGSDGRFAGLLKVGRDDTERRRVQEALGESEERFRQFAENSRDLLWIVDAEGVRLEYLSPAYEHIFGEPPDAVMADLGRWAELVHPDDRGTAAEGMPRLLAGEVVTQEYRVVRPSDGSVCWVRDTGFPIRDETGRVRRVAGITQDITARKHGEEALRQSEERLRAILEEATDYVILTTDANKIIDGWMPGAQAVFGWTAEEAIGQPLDITFTPEDRAAGVPAGEFTEAREQGVAPDVRWHQCKDGSRVFIDGSTRIRRSATGVFEGVLKIGRDATERWRFEAALRDSEARFRQFGDASADVLWIRDAETLANEYVSPAFERVYGMPVEYVMTGDTLRRWAELVLPEDRETALENIRRVRGGEQITHQFRVARPDGAICWVEDTSFPLLGPDGEVERVAGIGKDVTESKLAAERQRLLLAELQHRVRNILTVVRSVAARTGENSREVGDFLSHFDGRLGTLARTQSAVTRTEDVAVDLEEMVRDELLAVAADEDRIEVFGPTVRLRQRAAENLALALHELTTNAVKYGALASPKGRLSVTWEVHKPDGHEQLSLHWRESGVRAMDVNPKRSGFGRQLIEQALPYELGAATSLKFAGGGVRAVIELPLTPQNAVLE